MTRTQTIAQLRAIADSLETSGSEAAALRAELASEQFRNGILRRRIDTMVAQEDLHQVAGLRKELKRLNGLLNDQHRADANTSYTTDDERREAIRSEYGWHVG